MKLILTRHAETIENTKRIIQSHNPGKLSNKGKQQAKNLALRLSKEKIDIIYSSDLTRCKETLTPLLELKKFPVIYDKNLRERHFGTFTGKKMEDFLNWLKDNDSRWDFSVKIPKGETYLNVLKRTKTFLHKIIKKHERQTVLVMTHGATKVAIILNLLDKKPGKNIYLKYKAANASVSIIEVKDNGKHEIKLLNSLTHLN